MNRLSGIVAFVMLVIFVTMVAMAATYSDKARFMPLVIGIPAIGLCLLQLAMDIRAFRKARLAEAVPGLRRDRQQDDAPPVEVSAAGGLQAASGTLSVISEIRTWAYFVAYIGGVLLFGFHIAVPILVAVYLYVEAKLTALSKAAGSDEESYWKVVRRCFVLDPEITHLNNGTLGPMPGFLLQGVNDRLRMTACDPNCYHAASPSMYQMLEETRKKVAGFVNAEPEDIAFTRNTTEGMSVIALGFPMKAGDEVLTTDHEHVGGLACWEHKAAHEGIVVKKITLPIPPKSEDELVELFEKGITKKTRIVSFSHVTCTTGMLLPVKRICAMAHERGIPVCVDGAQVLGWCKTDLKDLDCDFYANSPHKWLFSPMGTGFLYVKKEHVPSIRAGIISSGWDTLKTAKKFETYGTRNLPEAIAVGDAVDFQEAVGLDRIQMRDHRLASYLKEGLVKIKGVTLLSSMDDNLSSPLTTILLSKSDGTDILVRDACTTLFERHKIRVRLVGEAGLNAIRISTHIYNSPECVDKMLGAVEDITTHGA